MGSTSRRSSCTGESIKTWVETALATPFGDVHVERQECCVMKEMEKAEKTRESNGMATAAHHTHRTVLEGMNDSTTKGNCLC